jgi:hypothetical protein
VVILATIVLAVIGYYAVYFAVDNAYRFICYCGYSFRYPPDHPTQTGSTAEMKKSACLFAAYFVLLALVCLLFTAII